MNDMSDPQNPYSVWHPWSNMAEMPGHVKVGPYQKSAGHHLFGQEGQVFDGSSGLWNVNIGHGREEIAKAVADRLMNLTFHSLIDTPSQMANALARRLLEKGPANLSRVMYHCNGTSATEGALMTIRQLNVREGRPEKTEIVALKGGFHGSSYLMASVSGLAEDAVFMAPKPHGIHHIPAPLNAEAAKISLDTFRALVAQRGDCIQSFIAEPLMGCEGAFVLPKDWLSEVAEICQGSDITIIADEIATGLGRTGEWYAWPQDVHVDALCVGKGLSAGYVPITATLYDKDIFDRFVASPGDEIRYGSTMDGCSASLACGDAVLSYLEKHHIPERVNSTRAAIEFALADLAALPSVQAIHGKGLMIGIRLCAPQHPNTALSTEGTLVLIDEIRKRGVLLDPEGNASILFYPPLTSTPEELHAALKIIYCVLAQADALLEQGPMQDA